MISKFKQYRVTGNHNGRFDRNSIQQCAANQFTQKPWSQRFAEQNFLRPVGLDRSRALKLQRSSVLVGDEQSTDVTAPVDFHGLHEAQSQLILFPVPRHPDSIPPGCVVHTLTSTGNSCRNGDCAVAPPFAVIDKRLWD